MIRAVLMDLDGTLIDTWRVYVEAYRGVLEEQGQRPMSSAEVAALRPAAELHFFDRVLGPGQGRAVQPRFLDHYARAHDRHFGGVYSGVPELLAALRSGPYALGIVTGKSRGAWRVTLDKLPVLAFPVVITDDDVPHPKPDPAGLRLALRQLGLGPEEAVYLGDSVVDAEAARAAGMTPLAALWPKGPEERERFLADVLPLGARVLEAPLEVMGALDALNRR